MWRDGLRCDGACMHTGTGVAGTIETATMRSRRLVHYGYNTSHYTHVNAVHPASRRPSDDESGTAARRFAANAAKAEKLIGSKSVSELEKYALRPGDRVVCVDRNKSRHASGGSLDAIRVGTNMKVFTVV